MVESLIAELEREYDGRIKVGKVHVDQNPRISSKYQIMGVPTFVLFNSGKEIQRRIGPQSKEQLRQMLGEVG